MVYGLYGHLSVIKSSAACWYAGRYTRPQRPLYIQPHDKVGRSVHMKQNIIKKTVCNAVGPIGPNVERKKGWRTKCSDRLLGECEYHCH